MVNKVALVRVGKDVDVATRRAIDLVDGFNPEEEATIVIKPNLCSIMPPESGVTTDVRVVEGVVRYLLDKNKREQRIIVAESNSEYNADEAFRRLGYEELEENYGVTLCNLSRDKRIRVEIPRGEKISYLEIPETLLFTDYLISVAKLKTHGFERFSGVWKNQFGLIPQKSRRPRLHPFLSKVLYDLNSIFYPDLSLIEGITALEGVGPIEGKPKNLNILICSRNPLSADMTASKVMGFSHRSVPHLKFAVKHKSKESEDILLVGDTEKISTEKRFESVPRSQYYLYRISLFLGRVGTYLEKAGEVAFTSAYALRTAGFKKLTSGRLFSVSRMTMEVRELLFKIEC